MKFKQCPQCSRQLERVPCVCGYRGVVLLDDDEYFLTRPGGNDGRGAQRHDGVRSHTAEWNE